MELGLALQVLGVGAATGTLALNVYRWLREKTKDGEVAPVIRMTLRALPDHASVEAIVAVLDPIMRRDVGGNVNLASGSDGGGAVNIEDARIEGGRGRDKGGDVNVTTGAGGPHGPGGPVNIGPGTVLRGGDAG